MQYIKNTVRKVVVDGFLVLEKFPELELALVTLKVKPQLQWQGIYPLTTTQTTELQSRLMEWFPFRKDAERVIVKVLDFFDYL